MATTPVIDQETITAEDELASLLSGLKGDVSVTNLAEQGDKKGADVMVKAYHAFDGRVWEGPLYMVTKEGGSKSITDYRFTKDQVEAVGADPKWVNKQVWHLTVQPVERLRGTIICRFHVEQTEEKRAEVEAMGLTPFCRHAEGFLTQAAEDNHARKRHPQWYRFQQTKSVEEERANAKAQSEAIAAQTAALLAIAEKLSAPPEVVVPAPVKEK